MIPAAYVQEWSSRAPWPTATQVEQDLIICRSLCDLFNSPALAGRIAFRGGTAIHKLIFERPLRYSEDIDLVQTVPEPIGETADAIRNALSWLGKCNWKPASHSLHFIFKFSPEAAPATSLKLKIEVNTREQQSLYPVKKYPFEVDSGWYRAHADIVSFEAEELFGTKLRALLQRRKNRDLFDMNEGLKQVPMDSSKLLASFLHYLWIEGKSISRATAEQRMLEKLQKSLTEDIAPLLPAGITFTEDEAIVAFGKIWFELITRIAGEPWKLSQEVIDEMRKQKIPGLLKLP